jgi:hypothetical protein
MDQVVVDHLAIRSASGYDDLFQHRHSKHPAPKEQHRMSYAAGGATADVDGLR